MSIYYVYAYIRATTSKTAKAGTPYYIGKGTRNRAWNKHVNVTLPKDKSRIVILENNLTELGAYALERRLISWWGRKHNKTGILLNRTPGGEGGISGDDNPAKRPETKQKISMAKMGHIVTSESREKMSLSKTGIPIKQEHLEKRIGKIRGPYNCSNMWITNGITSRKIPKSSSIPEGWRNGRVIKPLPPS